MSFKITLRLVRCGVTGKLLNIIKSMYSKLQCCVKFDGHFSNFFTSNIGVIQRNSLSPLLYSFYVNDMEIELINSGCQTYELKSLNLFLLMYADDTVLFSENVDELQKMINSVNMYSNEYGLYINLLKTKIVIFRNRGHVKAEEKWFLNGNKIDVCNVLMYLGILFYYTDNFVHSQKMLSNQGSKAVFSLCSNINEDCFNCETLLSLFDTYVSNILNYRCEVWGYHKADDVEKVHISYLKRILKVRQSAVNYMVYCKNDKISSYYFLFKKKILMMCTYFIESRNCSGNFNWKTIIKCILIFE